MHPDISPNVAAQGAGDLRKHAATGWRGRRAGSGAGARTRRHVTVAAELPCQSAPELFFAEDPQDLRRAKALCGDCPLRSACLTGALERGEPTGVWGGELLLRGVVIAGKRPRGRPRKADLAA
jgi:WhiB family transcriptional regulator, redox-sensing transcriptional regulator